MPKYVILMLVFTLVFSGIVFAEEAPDFDELKKEEVTSIKRGLKYIESQWNKVDGSFAGVSDKKVAATSVAGMAFLASGNTPSEGKYAKQVLGAIKYLLKKTNPNGYISDGGSRMYSHGFASLFLAESYGMSRDEKINKEVKSALTKSMKLLAMAQGQGGGWDYHPGKGRSDISITVCQTMAMRASRASGIEVSPKCVEEAIRCIKAAYCKAEGGGFSYTSPGGSGAAFPRSAGGACILYALGLHESEEVTKTLDYLNRIPPWKQQPSWYFYASYYSTYAMYQKGGKYWKEWFPQMKSHMLSKQTPAGSWQDTDSGGNTYSTAVACLVLQVPFRYLPIVQR